MSNKLGKRKRRERENLKTHQIPSKPFQKGWYKQQPKNDRDMFESISVGLIGLILTIIWAFFDYGYSGVHKALAFYCLMIGLLTILRRGDLKLIIENTNKVFSNYVGSNLSEIGDTVFLLAVMLSMLTILFIIDLEILSNAGIRIGAAGGVALVSVLGHVLKSLWSK